MKNWKFYPIKCLDIDFVKKKKFLQNSSENTIFTHLDFEALAYSDGLWFWQKFSLV